MTNLATKLKVDLEYTNIKDENASLVWIPGLDTFPKDTHDTIIDPDRHLKLSDIAGLSEGHAPWSLSSVFLQLIESSHVICAEPTEEPRKSFPPWLAVHEKGGGAVIPCN